MSDGTIHVPVGSEAHRWLQCVDEAGFDAMNATDLNEPASSVTRFASGRIMYVSRYIFHPDRLVGRSAFVIPQTPKSTLFCTRTVVDALSTEDGVGFRQVWPRSEAG